MSSDSACRHAKKAVGTYGSTVLRDAFEDKESLDKAATELIVGALDAAADAARNPAVKQAIRNLASAYSKFQALHDRIEVGLEKRILSDTSHLYSECGY